MDFVTIMIVLVLVVFAAAIVFTMWHGGGPELG
jgi:flagellar basal body-associated protein FliL